MENIQQAIKKLLEVFSVLIMSVMSIMVFVNVVLRYGFNSSLTTSEELSRYLFIWLTFSASILAYAENQHIGVDFVVKKLNKVPQKVVKVLADLLVLICCAFMTHGSLLLTEMGAVEISPVTSIPMSYVYLSGVVGGIGIGIVCLVKIIADIKE